MFFPRPFFETSGQLEKCKCFDCQCKVSVSRIDCCRCLERQCEVTLTPAVDWSSIVDAHDERKEIHTTDHVDGQRLLITPIPVALAGITKLAQPVQKPRSLAVALEAPMSEPEPDIQDVTDFSNCSMTQDTAAPASARSLESELSQLTDHHELIGLDSQVSMQKLSAERLVNLAMTLKTPLPKPDTQDVTELDTCRTHMTQSTAAPASARTLESDVSEATHQHELNGADFETMNQMLAAEHPGSLAIELEGPLREAGIQEISDLDTCRTVPMQSTAAPAAPAAPAVPAAAFAVAPGSACNLESELTGLTDEPELDVEVDVSESEVTKQTPSAELPGSFAPVLDGCLQELDTQDISDLDTCRTDLMQITAASEIGAEALTAMPASGHSLESELNELTHQPEVNDLKSQVAKRAISTEQPESLALALDGCLQELDMQDMSDLDTCRTDLMQITAASAAPGEALTAVPASGHSLESELNELTDQPESNDLKSEVTKQAISTQQPESLALALDGPLHELIGGNSEETKQTLIGNNSEETKQTASAERPASLAVTLNAPLPEHDIQGLDTCRSDLTENITAAAAAPQAAAAICSSESDLCEVTEDPEVKDLDVQVTSQTLSDWYDQEEDDGQFFEVAPASLKLADVREEYENFRKFKSTSAWLRDGHPQPSCESERTKTYVVHDTFKRESSDRDRHVLPYPYPYSFH